MRELYDDLEDFEFDFDESTAARRMMREIQIEKALMGSRRRYAPGLKRNWDDLDDDDEDDDDFDDDFDDYDDDDDYEDYEDYSDDQYDRD